MTTQLDICKMALAEVGSRSTITALNDGSIEANYCSLYYGPTRDHALRAARWNFAHYSDLLALWKSAQGTPENPTVTSSVWTRTQPARPWLYSYKIDQTGFVYARSIIAQLPTSVTSSPPIFSVVGLTLPYMSFPRVPFDIAIDPYDQAGSLLPSNQGQRVVLCNIQNPLFEYTGAYNDETTWDSSFVLVQTLALSARLAIALTSDKQLANMKIEAANAIIMQARAADGNEGITVMDHVPDWLTTRGVPGGNDNNFFYYPYGPLFSLFL